jgi:hypothetical protein
MSFLKKKRLLAWLQGGSTLSKLVNTMLKCGRVGTKYKQWYPEEIRLDVTLFLSNNKVHNLLIGHQMFFLLLL